MQSPLAIFTIACAAVYAHAGISFLFLFRRARKQKRNEYLDFAAVCGSLAIYAVGSAILTDATDLERGDVGVRVQAFGFGLLMASLSGFACSLVGRPARATRLVGAAYAALGAVLAGLDLVGTEVQAARPTWGFAAAPVYAQPELTPWTGAFLVAGWLFLGYTLSVLAGRAHEDREARLVMAALLVNVGAGAHDVLISVASLRSWNLVEHSAMVSVVAMGAVLVQRFVRTHDELETRTAELSSSYAGLRVADDELVRTEQLAAVGELSALVAHGVKGALTSIRNAARGLRHPETGADDRSKLLVILDDEVDRLNRLVTDLLEYARPVAPQKRLVRLAEILERSLATAREHDVEVVLELSDEASSARVDPDLLRNALDNIVDNALLAMPNGGTLRVASRPVVVDSEPCVELAFTDSGEGMDSEVRTRAGEPFFTTRPGSAGLGLAIVERAVRAHGGTFSIDSQASRGTTVRLVLPLGRPSGEIGAAHFVRGGA